MKLYPPTPELNKMLAVKNESQEIGNFLEWLGDNGVILAEYRGEELNSYSYTIEKLLAKYFGIDLVKADDEKRAILESLRN